MRRFVIAGLLALAPACTPVEFDGQDLELTYIQEEGKPDALELFVRYRGLHAPSGPWLEDDGNKLRDAVAWVRRLEQRERVFILQGWPLDFDLEQDAEGEASEVEGRLRDAVRVTEASIYLDQDGRLCADQRLRWTDVQGSLAALNRSWTRELAAQLNPEELKKDFDEASSVIFLRHIEEERPWLELDAQRLRLTIPLSLRALRNNLAEGLERSDEEQLEELRRDSHAESVKVDESGVHFLWAFGKDGVLTLVDPPAAEAGSFALRDRLMATGSKLETRELERQ
ncbi:MAG: hypothetical protein O2816_04000 [Planctomycetota bacterium]|nr:hypothetical protein [Planctomycetota bacterium]